MKRDGRNQAADSSSAGGNLDLDGLVDRHGLPAGAAQALGHLLAALSAEPDPPTAVRDPAVAVESHVADSLAGLVVAELLHAARIADIGSGAGFPGLPLAVALPGARVDLVESSARKCAAIDRLIAGARVANARSVRARVEDWGAGEGREGYDAVTARALAALPVVVEYGAPLLRPGGTLVVWRGARDGAAERAADAAGAQVGLGPGDARKVKPFEGARARHLHVYVKVAPTPGRFPRRPGRAVKRPLG